MGEQAASSQVTRMLPRKSSGTSGRIAGVRVCATDQDGQRPLHERQAPIVQARRSVDVNNLVRVQDCPTCVTPRFLQ